jgi:hypothetical protein
MYIYKSYNKNNFKLDDCTKQKKIYLFSPFISASFGLGALRQHPSLFSLYHFIGQLAQKSQFFFIFQLFYFFVSEPYLKGMFLSTKEKASKSLRRLTKTKISTPIAQINTLELPKKIIKALYDYQAKAPHEISFKKGDFFHVTGRENDLDWFEACNPASNLKGVVPVSYFQVIDKTERSLAVNRPTSSSTSSTLTSELDSGFSDMSIHGKFYLYTMAHTSKITHVFSL